MKKGYQFLWVVLALAMVLSLLALSGCSGNSSTSTTPAASTTSTASSTPTTSTGPGPGGAVVQSDSIISAEVKAIRSQSTGYPWEMDILVDSSENVNTLPNPTADKVGQVITVKTDEDASVFKVGQMITARVKYVGDVPKPGISLYIYDIQAMPAAVAAGLGQEFTLSAGQYAAITGEDLAIKFVEVTADSRCPQGVTCIWAGEVSCLVQVTKGNLGPSKMTLTESGAGGPASMQDYGAYEIAYHVEPYPVAGKQIARDEYRLIMTVTKNAAVTTEIGPAPIDDVKVAVTLSQPREILVYIKGGLKDTCTTFYNLNTGRTGDNITIEVNVQTATGQICGYVYTFFERCVNLGSDFMSGQAYTVKVNDKTTTFTMP